MIKFEVISLFPKIFENYLGESILSRACRKKLIKVRIHDLRRWAGGRRVDDRPYGGGPGMVMRVEPIVKAVQSVKSKMSVSGGESRKLKVILFAPAGKQFDNRAAAELAKNYKNLILICGRYEGIDARAEKAIKDLKLKVEKLSVGPYVLTGGELPALVLIDAVSRQIPGVLGKRESIEERRFGVGVPAYTRPEVFVYKVKKYRVPKVLLSGNHKKIEEWKKSGSGRGR